MSLRYNILSLGFVNRLKTITPANGYINDFSGAGAVDVGIETDPMRVEGPENYHLQIREGQEIHDEPEIHSDNRTATWNVTISLMVRGRVDEDPRKRLNDAIADINRCIHLDQTLNGTCSRVWIAGVDEPRYDSDARVSWAEIQAALEYHYTAGAVV